MVEQVQARAGWDEQKLMDKCMQTEFQLQEVKTVNKMLDNSKE